MLKNILKSSFALSLALSLNTQAATEVVVILDVSGSTAGLISNWQDRIEAEVFDVFLAHDPDTRFGLASHIDFPFSPYGGSTDYPYKLEVALTTDTSSIVEALGSLSSGGGSDAEESQLEAIYQAFVGNGLDLNDNGDFTDLGDLQPQIMGWNGGNNTKIIINFTNPINYHNDPLEPNYPYVGVVNNPATLDDVMNIADSFPATYTLTDEPLPEASAILSTSTSAKGIEATIDDMNALQNYTKEDEILSAKYSATIATPRFTTSATLTTAEKLATITDGAVLHIDRSLSGLSEVISTIIDLEDDKNGDCKFGETLIETPFSTYCIKV